MTTALKKDSPVPVSVGPSPTVQLEPPRVRYFRCKCGLRMHNRTLAEIADHRATHGLSGLPPGAVTSPLVARPKKKPKIRGFSPQSIAKTPKSKPLKGKKKWKRQIQELQRKIEDQAQALAKVRRVIPSTPPRKPHPFYDSDVWRDLRYSILRRDGRVCVLCRATSGEMHVDHIKPRSKYPHLELDPNNLQVLCRDCNLGKSNIDETDWRPVTMGSKANGSTGVDDAES